MPLHPPIPNRQIRVLIVDDSALTRRVLRAALESAPDITVVGALSDGEQCLARMDELAPDVVTLDVEMPGLNGLEVLRRIMARRPVPVVMVSYLTHEGTDATVRALLDGAVDFVPKPGGPIVTDLTRLRDDLLRKVRAAARSRPAAARATRRPVPTAPAPLPPRRPMLPPAGTPPLRPRAGSALAFDHLVVLGASTGGPQALQTVLEGLPPNPRTAFLVVQHMPAGMTQVLAELLDGCSTMRVREAQQHDRLEPGAILMVPGDFHLRLGPGGLVELDQGPRVHFVRPSVDVTLLSAAELYGSHTVATILTGMGMDGADGAAAIHAAGGGVIISDEQTSVVWGMPKAVFERGVADQVLPLPEIARAISSRLAAPSTVRRQHSAV
ncbi:MAG: chemotaxis-specific protein-glutamate methyltransferase CheB [Chloroflexota bacterium]